MRNDGVPCDASFGGNCINVQYTLKGIMASAMVVGVTVGQRLSGEWKNPAPAIKTPPPQLLFRRDAVCGETARIV